MSWRLQQLIAALFSVLLLSACAAENKTPSNAAGYGMLPAASANYSATFDTQLRSDAHLQLALAYYQQSQWQVALDEVALALRAEPYQADALSMRGLIYMASGRPALAGPAFLQALQIAPNRPDYLNNYAWFLCHDGDAHASLRWFEKAAAQPDYRTPEKALNNAGACSVVAGDPGAAKIYFLRAAAIQPDNVQSNIALAKIYLIDGDYLHASLHADRAVAVKPPGAGALWVAIKVARRSEHPSAETKLLAQLRSLYPESAEYAAYQRGVFDE